MNFVEVSVMNFVDCYDITKIYLGYSLEPYLRKKLNFLHINTIEMRGTGFNHVRSP